MNPPLAIALTLAIVPSAFAQRFEPVADATVRSDTPTTNYGSSTELGLGKDRNASNSIYFMRTFFRFDVSSVKFPVHDATLYFYEDRTIAAGGLPVTSYELTQGFVESTVTWNNKPTDSGMAITSVKVGDNFNRGWKAFPITAQVRAWIASPASNHGVVIRLASESTAGAYRPGFGPSRDHAAVLTRPYLLIDTSTVHSFAKGCGPVATWPRMQVTSGAPKINTAITLAGTLLAPSANCLTVIGLSNTSWSGVKLPFTLDPVPNPPCQLLVSLDLILGGLTDTNGQRTHGFLIPNDPRLVGLHVYLQMATLGANNHMTDGLDLTIH